MLSSFLGNFFFCVSVCICRSLWLVDFGYGRIVVLLEFECDMNIVISASWQNNLFVLIDFRFLGCLRSNEDNAHSDNDDNMLYMCWHGGLAIIRRNKLLLYDFVGIMKMVDDNPSKGCELGESSSEWSVVVYVVIRFVGAHGSNSNR